ncbi:MAG: hypothetical protein WDW20_00720, partial [Neisseriaceae bacterium]
MTDGTTGQSNEETISASNEGNPIIIFMLNSMSSEKKVTKRIPISKETYQLLLLSPICEAKGVPLLYHLLFYEG